MLRQRVITALWLAPLALVGLFALDGSAFALFIGLVVVLGAWEWANLASIEAPRSRLGYALGIAVLMGLMWLTGMTQAVWPLWLAALVWLCNLYWVVNYPQRQAQWGAPATRLALGVVVLLPCWVGFLWLRASGAEWLLFVLLLVWCADTGAYFTGRAFGKRKLAPRVSPGKSIEGVVGGLAVTTLLAVIFAAWQGLGVSQGVALVVGTWLVTLVSVLGDLFESMLKRFRGLKDSSALLPGHGGVLDRIDSLTAAVPLFALLTLWM